MPFSAAPPFSTAVNNRCKAPPKQKHTARRIFERLRDEHGSTGGETVVKDTVREWRIGAGRGLVGLGDGNERDVNQYGNEVLVVSVCVGLSAHTGSADEPRKKEPPERSAAT
jgi:hypothetical protein